MARQSLSSGVLFAVAFLNVSINYYNNFMATLTLFSTFLHLYIDSLLDTLDLLVLSRPHMVDEF